MLAFRAGRIEVVCAVVVCAVVEPHPWERSRPRHASRLDASRSVTVPGDDAIGGSCGEDLVAEGRAVRHIACRITASFRARATLAFLGPVRSAIARA
jgi:hypothetical protein